MKWEGWEDSAEGEKIAVWEDERGERKREREIER